MFLFVRNDILPKMTPESAKANVKLQIMFKGKAPKCSKNPEVPIYAIESATVIIPIIKEVRTNTELV